MAGFEGGNMTWKLNDISLNNVDMACCVGIANQCFTYSMMFLEMSTNML